MITKPTKYSCPECGKSAPRKEGGKMSSRGLPLICREHGEVFLKVDLPILGLLSQPFITPEKLKLGMAAARSRKWRANNPGASSKATKDWRERNPNWAEGLNARRWAKVLADPAKHEERKQQWREWRQKNREGVNAKKREEYANGD